METENKNVAPAPTPQAEGGKSKKGLLILIGVIAVLVLAKLVFGGTHDRFPGGNMYRGPGGETTYATNEGSVTVGANKLPDNWPGDAPVYANAEIQSAVSANPQAGQAQSAVVFATRDSAQSVADFYKKELAAKGWKVEQTVASGAGSVIAATKDTRTFGVYIADSGDGKTVVTTSVANK